MSTATIFLIVILALVAYIISIYNRLVRHKNLVEEGWSGIETQLKRRANLIPNLIETVKGYAGHEKDTLEDVVRLRNQATSATDVAERGVAEGMLTKALGKLFALAEAYPDLKANENFMQLQGALQELEDQIQLARRYYNGTVRDMNILVESFPSNFVAGQFNFSRAKFFEIEEDADRAVPQVSFESD
ncbi:MAG: LemA family protein [Gammaproteobacteria bacterium]|nr:LemA family protein [Gammaproteobacteria bacterium]